MRALPDDIRRAELLRELCLAGRGHFDPASSGGGGGNRTRVRKGSYEKLYTLSRLVFLSRRGAAERQMAPKPARAFHPRVTGVTRGLSRIVVASLDRLGRAT